MNLCNFCVYECALSKSCAKIIKFVRPVGQRVFCCRDFKQYPESYADITYAEPIFPNDFHVIGCIGSKPSKKERKKNQINYTL